MNQKQVVFILQALMSEYSVRFTEAEKTIKVRTWGIMLENVTDEQGKNGLMKALDNPGDFMPPIGKFKQMCLSGDGCNSLEDEARMAWALVINNLNAYSSPVFKDSAIAEAIRNLGGWKRLCGMLEEEMPFRKKDFIDLYLVMKRQNRDFPNMLTGIYCDDYKFIGYDKKDDISKVKLQIENKKNADKKCFAMLMQSVKNRKKEE